MVILKPSVGMMLTKLRETLHKDSKKIAVTYLDAGNVKTLSYAELDILSDTLANTENLQGIKPETVVGVFADPSQPAWMVSILAIWKRGGAVLLLNSDLAEVELTYRLNNVNCQSVIVCVPDPRPESNRVLRTLNLCIMYHASVQRKDNTPQPTKESNNPSELAYVAYTSGSTGKPKAIAITHAGIVPLTDAHLRFFANGGNDDVILQDSSLDFDPCWMQFFLVCRGIPCLQWDRRVITLEKLPPFLQEHGVTTVMWVPSFMADLDPQQFPGLRLIFTIGEACSAEFLAPWSKPPRRLILTYGPSESTVGCGLSLFHGKIHLGYPSDGMKFHILSKKKLNPVKATKKGQLALSGPGLARGYVLNGKLVSEIIPETNDKLKKSRSRFTTVTLDGMETRVFLTGDWVERDKQDDILFLGRHDRQIKIRGKRIEVFAVERSISEVLQHLEIRIIPHRINQNGLSKYDYLVACFIAPPEPFPIDPANIISTINKTCPYLPEIPKEWYLIRDRKAFLQKKSSKFNYQELSRVYHDTREQPLYFSKLSSPSAPPQHPEITLSSLEKQIIAVIRKVIDPLCTDADIVASNFDDLAGKSSLLWTALMQSLEQRFSLVLQCHRHFHLNFPISELIDDIALQILFSKAWVKSTTSKPYSGNSTKLFCCPPVSGDPRHFNKIAWKIAVETYGLMMPPLFATRSKLPDETEMAAADRQAAYQYYVQHCLYQRLDLIAQYAFQAMRHIQANGPYYICGYSWGGQLAFEIALQVQKNHFELGWLGILDAAYPGVLSRLQEPHIGMQLLRELYTQVFVFIGKRETFKIELAPELEANFDINASPSVKLASLYQWLEMQFRNDKVIAKASTAQIKQCQQFFESIYWNILAALHYRPDRQLENHNNVTVFHTELNNDHTCMSAFAPEWEKHFKENISRQLIQGVKHLELLENQEFAIRLSSALQRCHPDNTPRAPLYPSFVSMAELQKMHWNLPTIRSHYVKRPELDAALQAALPGQGTEAARTVFFVGFGGLGKSNSLTNLITVYSNPCGPHYELIIFFNYSECTDFLSILKNLLKERLPSDNGDNLTLTSALTLFYGKYLKSIKGRTLVVFDNVIDNNDVLHLLGIELRQGGYCDVFIATRNADTPSGCISIHITDFPFTRENAIELINQHPSVNQWPTEDKHRLCERLENYPLALDMAAAYCDKQNHSCDHYLRKLDYLLVQFMGNAVKPAIGVDRTYHQTVTSIVLTTIDHMKKDENTMLVPLMNVIALLNPTEIRKTSVFLAMCAYFESQKLARFQLEFSFETALIKLEQLNLVETPKTPRISEDTGRLVTPRNVMTACHISVSSILCEVQRDDIAATLRRINQHFDYPLFECDNEESVAFYQHEGLSFISQFLSACLKFGIAFTHSTLKLVESLYKFIAISCNSTPLLHKLAVLLVEVIKEKYQTEIPTESSTEHYGVVLTYLANFIGLEEDLSPLARSTFEFILNMPLDEAQLHGVRALYLKQLTRFHAPNDPKVMALTDELVVANPNSYQTVTAKAESMTRAGNYYGALPLYIAILQMHRAKKHNKREIAVALLNTSTCACKLGHIRIAVELGSMAIQLVSDYFKGEYNPNYWKNFARFIEIMIDSEQVDIATKLFKQYNEVIQYVLFNELAVHFLNSAEIELVPNCLTMISNRQKVYTAPPNYILVTEPIHPELQIILAKLYFAFSDYRSAIKAIAPILSGDLVVSALLTSKATALMLCAKLSLGMYVEPQIMYSTLSVTVKAYHRENNPDYALILYHLAFFIATKHPYASTRALPFLEKAIHINKLLSGEIAYPSLGRCYVLRAKLRSLVAQQRGLPFDETIFTDLDMAETLFAKAYGPERIHPDKIEAGLIRCDRLLTSHRFSEAHRMLIALNDQNEGLAIPRIVLKQEITRRLQITAHYLAKKEVKSTTKTYSTGYYTANVGLIFSHQMHHAVRVPPSEHPGGIIMTKNP
jgi:acyl-coenzyme A synthetase/AMP-(fatty) acid ligase/thioesterase domain-containing protein